MTIRGSVVDHKTVPETYDQLLFAASGFWLEETLILFLSGSGEARWPSDQHLTSKPLAILYLFSPQCWFMEWYMRNSSYCDTFVQSL